MKRSLILVTVIGLLFALSSVAFGQSTPAKKKVVAKVSKPTNAIKKTTTTQKPLKNQTSGSGGVNGIEMTPCDVQGNNSGSNKTANARGKNQNPTANGVTSPAGTWECAKANDENTQRSTKTTNFQTTSEDLQSVKKAKTQNGVNDPGDWSSEAKPKTIPKSSNTTSKKRKVNGIHEGNELKTPKKKP